VPRESQRVLEAFAFDSFGFWFLGQQLNFFGDLGYLGISLETWLKPGWCPTAVLRPPLILRRVGTCTVPMPGRKLWRKHCFHGLHGLFGAETENQRIYDMDDMDDMDISKEACCLSYCSSGTQSMFLFLSTWVLRFSDFFGSRHHLFVCSNSGGKPPARDGVKDVNTTQCIYI
jgi:hypothetical protein